MNVLIAGMQRSGSTFTFNVARMLLEPTGPVTVSTGDTLLPVGSRESMHYVHKAHLLDRQSLSEVLAQRFYIIISYRDPVEAIASWMDTFEFSLDQSIEHYRRWSDLFSSVRQDALCLPFEVIDRTPWNAMRRIARHLGVRLGVLRAGWIRCKLSKRRVARECRRLGRRRRDLVDVGFSEYDPATLFHVDHIKSLRRRRVGDILTRSDVDRIRDEFGYVSRQLPPRERG